MHFVYILRCADDTLYVGCTNNLHTRLKEHGSSPRGARYTKMRRPVSLVYHEAFAERGDALRREIEIKSWRRAKKLALLVNGKVEVVTEGEYIQR